MDDLISVIIPVYNSEKYLKKSIESVMFQTYRNLEIILIDDGSTDKSAQICDKYAKNDVRIKVIHKKNEGVSIARNAGIEVSSGDYITFVDGDDWIEKDAIESLHKALINNNSDIVRGNYYREDITGVYGKGNFYSFENKNINKDDFELRNKLLIMILTGKFLSYVWLLLIKKSLLIENKILFKKDISFMEDTLFYVELICTKSKIYFLDKETYHYFDNLDSATKSLDNVVRNIYSLLKVNNDIRNILNKKQTNNDVLKSEMDTNHCNMIINLFFKLYKNNPYEKNRIKEEIRKILKNENFNSIIQNADSNKMPIHFKIQYLCIKRKKINFLFFYYIIRKILSKIKDIIQKRKGM